MTKSLLDQANLKPKKDEIIVISCSVCGDMSHAIKNPKMPDGYRVKEAEFVICKFCFGGLK